MTDKSKDFVIKVGEEFTIKLDSNPTTGYRWQPSFDDSILTLISTEFIPTSKMLGSHGMEYFNFKARKVDTTLVKMIYTRSWEKETIKEIEFPVTIT